MTDYPPAILDAVAGENAVVVDIAKRSVRAQKLALVGVYYDAQKGAVVDVRDKIREELERVPARKKGSYTVTDVPSFVDYIKKHALGQTEMWASVNQGTVKAVINAHMGTTGDGVEDYAGHEDHTAFLALTTSDDWKEWMANDGKLLPQLAFAEFIEDHLPNFVSPTAADMLELAQTFQATTKGEFKSSQRIKSGETQIAYVEEHQANAGKKGDLTIPDTFTIALQPFETSPLYKVEARFRYRITEGHLQLGYRLTRPKDVRRAAFNDVVKFIADDTERTIWATS